MNDLLCTGCSEVCDIFDQPVRSTKFHQLLVIYDSFCSWKVTNLIQNFNSNHNPKGWLWELLNHRCQNPAILTFYPDLANLTHLNSDFFQVRHCSVINKENFSKIWNNEHTKKVINSPKETKTQWKIKFFGQCFGKMSEFLNFYFSDVEAVKT